MKLVSVSKSERQEKRLKAIFEDPKRTIHFGFKKGSTFIDHQDDAKRKAYIARHHQVPYQDTSFGNDPHSNQPSQDLSVDSIYEMMMLELISLLFNNND